MKLDPRGRYLGEDPEGEGGLLNSLLEDSLGLTRTVRSIPFHRSEKQVVKIMLQAVEKQQIRNRESRMMKELLPKLADKKTAKARDKSAGQGENIK